MIVSTDYSYLRSAASPSDAMKEKHPEKRSWWVDPKGKIYDVGHDHNKFLEWHPKIFGDGADINKALTMNWVRVAFWGGEYIVHCHSITRAQVAACQEIYKSLGGEHKIYVSTLNKYGYISPHDFIWADSASDLIRNLFKDPIGIRSSVTASEVSQWMKRQYPDKRSWWVRPDGKVIDAGYDHDKAVRKNPDIFWYSSPEELLEEKGWVKVGSYGNELVINAISLNEKQLEAAQSLYYETNKPVVYLVFKDIYGKITKDEFLQANSVNSLRKELRVRSGSREAAGGNRAWLISPQGEGYSCGFLHHECGFNKKLLKAAQKINPKVDESDVVHILMKEGWARVGYFEDPSIAYLDVHPVTGSIFRKFQEILSSLNMPNNAKVKIGSDEFKWKNFRFFDSMTDAKKFLWHNREGSSRRRAGSEERAWLISPQGKAYLCGFDHNTCSSNKELIKAAKEINPTLDEGYVVDVLLEAGWARCGYFDEGAIRGKRGIPAVAFLDSWKSITISVFSKFKELISFWNLSDNTKVVVGKDTFYWKDFKFFDSMTDVNKFLWHNRGGSSRRGANGSDRAWLVSPTGKVINCGEDHRDFIDNNRDLLKSAGADPGETLEELVEEGWGKVGLLSALLLYIECKRLNDLFFKVLQDFTKRFEEVDRVMINSKKIIDRREFLQMDSPVDVRLWPTVESGRRFASEYEGRAWLVSPQGQIVNCGSNHERFVLDNRDFFKEMGYDIISSYPLIKDGWARIGIMSTYLYIECIRLTTEYFDILHDMALSMKFINQVHVTVGADLVKFTKREFLELESPNEVNRHLLVVRRKTSSLPKSRNFLLGVSLDEMPWPLRSAFDLLNLSEKKDKLSANQVVSVFQAHDEFLQEHLSRTSTELIRDLNAFFQYGQPKQEQIV